MPTVEEELILSNTVKLLDSNRVTSNETLNISNEVSLVNSSIVNVNESSDLSVKIRQRQGLWNTNNSVVPRSYISYVRSDEYQNY